MCLTHHWFFNNYKQPINAVYSYDFKLHFSISFLSTYLTYELILISLF